MRQLCFVLVAALTAIALPTTAFAQKAKLPTYTFTSFDAFGSNDTRAGAINNDGTSVGYFAGSDGILHGFYHNILWAAGPIQYDDPALTTTSTLLQGINNNGVMSGLAKDSPRGTPDAGSGFIWRGGTDVTTYTVPGASFTAVKGINVFEQFAGRFVDSNGHSLGFVQSGDTFTIIDYMGSTSVQCGCINDLGQVEGSYRDGGGTQRGFLLDSALTTFTDVNYPRSIYTQALGMNNNNQVVGTYQLARGAKQGFVLNVATGAYTTVNYPNAYETFVTGITDSGTLVGHWRDSLGMHSFYAVRK